MDSRPLSRCNVRVVSTIPDPGFGGACAAAPLLCSMASRTGAVAKATNFIEDHVLLNDKPTSAPRSSHDCWLLPGQKSIASSFARRWSDFAIAQTLRHLNEFVIWVRDREHAPENG